MRLRNLGERVARLEGNGGSDAVLTFSDGTRAGLKVGNALGLICDAMRREYYAMEGREDPRGPSRYASTLSAMSRAECCEGDQLLETAHSVLHPQGVSNGSN